MNNSTEIYDAIIIGAGPAGCTAALYLARAQRKTLVLFRSEKEGALAWTSLIENYPGFESLSGYELITKMRKHAEKFGATFKKGWVNALTIDGNIKNVSTVEGEVYQCKTLIVATGALERASKVPGEEKFIGKGVSYCATCDAAFFKNKSAVVVADTEASFEEAVFVSRFASKVTLLVPTKVPKVEPQTLKLVKENSVIQYVENAHPKEILGDDIAKELKYKVGTEDKTIVADGFFLLSGGSKPSVSFLKGHVEFAGESCVKVNDQYETSVPGIYAVGDVLCSHIKQAVIAAAEGCTAALAADQYISGRKTIRIDWT